jgi:hypothetical protein
MAENPTPPQNAVEAYAALLQVGSGTEARDRLLSLIAAQKLNPYQPLQVTEITGRTSGPVTSDAGTFQVISFLTPYACMLIGASASVTAFQWEEQYQPPTGVWVYPQDYFEVSLVDANGQNLTTSTGGELGSSDGYATLSHIMGRDGLPYVFPSIPLMSQNQKLSARIRTVPGSNVASGRVAMTLHCLKWPIVGQ